MRGIVAGFVWCAGVLALTGCAARRDPPRSEYVPLKQLEATYGPLITAGNHPTPDQHGTGDRLGLFRDTKGTVWGLPLTLGAGGSVMGCAPSGLRSAEVTGTYPADETIIGATNEPTGWRGGTGRLELLMRAADGAVHWSDVQGARLAAGPVCWAQESPGPPQALLYYRLTPARK